MTKATRVWKRTGDRNLMDLDSAVLNLQSHALDPWLRARSKAAIAELLKSGERLETRLAIIFVADGDGRE